MNWKIISYIAILLIILVIIKWFADSKSYGEYLVFSKDKKPVVTKTVDSLFGTTSEKTEWREGFWLGLLPNDDTLSFKLLLGVAPLGGIFLVFVVAGFIADYYRKKRQIITK